MYISVNRIGPTLGSLLAVLIYGVMKRFKYWKLNEGQDTDESSKSPALFSDQDGSSGQTPATQTRRVHLQGIQQSLESADHIQLEEKGKKRGQTLVLGDIV